MHSPPLTMQEHKVLRLLADGMTRQEIGSNLHISPSTAKSHIYTMYGKLGARNAPHAIAIAFRTGLLRGN